MVTDYWQHLSERIRDTLEGKYAADEKFRQHVNELMDYPDQLAARRILDSGFSLMILKEACDLFAEVNYGIENDELKAIEKSIEVLEVLIGKKEPTPMDEM